jgi:CheY-like chemotaxis protein
MIDISSDSVAVPEDRKRHRTECPGMTQECHAGTTSRVDSGRMSTDRDAGGGSGIAVGGRRVRRSVMVADDSVDVRRAMVPLIGNDAAFSVVADVGDAPDAVAAAARHQPDIAVLDVHMPGGGGAEAASRIRDAAPSTRIVAHSANDDAFSRRAMLDAGAVAYAVKGRDALLDVLRSLAVE